jgi:cell wall-associated NlpC family hydrolase
MLKTDKPGRLRFEPNNTVAPPPVKPKQNPVIQEAQPVTNENPPNTPVAEQRQETQESPASTQSLPENGQSPLKHDESDTPLRPEPDAPLREDTAETPLHEEKTDAPLKPDKPGKLRFAEDETAPTPPTRGEIKQQRKLGKAQKQADRAVTKLENAKGKLPAKKKLRTKVEVGESGKPKRKLYFESEVKPQGEHLKGALPMRPVKAAGNSALMYGHRKLYQVEHENVGVKAAHRAEMFTEGGVRAALRHHKTAPYRKVAKLEQAAQKKAVNLTYQQTLAQNPKLKSNILSRALQKRKIKKDYAKAAREAKKAADRAKKAGSAAGNAVKAVAGVVKRHPIASVVIILIALLLFCLMSLIGAFGGMGSGGLGGIVASTYLAEDADMLAAEAAYSGMEADLQNELNNYAALHPGYDEYVFDLDDIEHDPYVLMSILSSLHDGAWTADGVQATLAMLFERQYILTESVTTETRYRPETDPTTGESTQVPYTYYKCTVTLENFNLSHLPIYIMDEDRLSRYALFTATLGNRPDLFPVSAYPHASVYKDYGRYDIPPEYFADETFAAMMTEAQKYLGMPYVWGGYSPKTSFDCSGFVSWVINHSGWNVGRLGAQGLYNISTPVSAADAKPGDLVFFHSTYDAPGITHVGIYVGDGMMVHAGDPIGFASIETPYFQQHFQGFGKLY